MFHCLGNSKSTVVLLAQDYAGFQCASPVGANSPQASPCDGMLHDVGTPKLNKAYCAWHWRHCSSIISGNRDSTHAADNKDVQGQCSSIATMLSLYVPYSSASSVLIQPSFYLSRPACKHCKLKSGYHGRATSICPGGSCGQVPAYLGMSMFSVPAAHSG